MIDRWQARRQRRNQLPSGLDVRKLRAMSEVELFEFIASWKEGSAYRIAGEVELRRRENWTARAALVIAFVSLVVSFLNAALS